MDDLAFKIVSQVSDWTEAANDDVETTLRLVVAEVESDAHAATEVVSTCVDTPSHCVGAVAAASSARFAASWRSALSLLKVSPPAVVAAVGYMALSNTTVVNFPSEDPELRRIDPALLDQVRARLQELLAQTPVATGDDDPYYAVRLALTDRLQFVNEMIVASRVTPQSDAVALPAEVTEVLASPLVPPTKDDQSMLKNLQAQLAASDILNDDQRKDLQELIERALAGRIPASDVARRAWQLMEEDLLARARQAGVGVEEVSTNDRKVYKLSFDPKNEEHVELLEVLKAALQFIQDLNPAAAPFLQKSSQDAGIFYLPSWEYLFEGYGISLERIQFVAHDPTPHEIMEMRRRGKTPVQLALTSQKFFSHTKKNTHGLGFAMHDVYHADYWHKLPDDIKSFVLDFYDRLYFEWSQLPNARKADFNRLIEQVVDVALTKPSLDNLIHNCLFWMALLAEKMAQSEWSLDEIDWVGDTLYDLTDWIEEYAELHYVMTPDTEHLVERIYLRCQDLPCAHETFIMDPSFQ